MGHLIVLWALVGAQVLAVRIAYLQSQIGLDLKQIMIFPFKYFVLVYFTTVLFAIAYAYGIKLMPFVVIVVMSIALNFVLSLLLTWFVLHQQISFYQRLGIGFILIGLVLINRPALVELTRK